MSSKNAADGIFGAGKGAGIVSVIGGASCSPYSSSIPETMP
jgi:hypothetical protein